MPAELISTNATFSSQWSDAPLPGPRLASLPILLLNVHQHCNCRCIMCDIWQREDGKELDLADFGRHRNSIEALGVKHIVLTGGEPLLHRNFEALCRSLKEFGVQITLLTTGLLLAKRAAVVAELVDEVIVSLDGPEEVHDRVRRVNGAFRLVGDGVIAVRRHNSALPIRGRSTVQKANHHLLRKTVAGAKLLGMSSISFLAADLTSQSFNRELIWPGERQSQISLTPGEIRALEEEITQLIAENADDIQSKYIVESPSKLLRIVRRFREQLGEMAPQAPRCNAPWVSAVMEVDGSVRPCFFHPSFGSTRTETLAEVINCDEALQFRESLNVSENPTCQRCVCALNYKHPEAEVSR
jgi:MoaA/NifB/PqqE/SkfB family radical SAM enzyme